MSSSSLSLTLLGFGSVGRALACRILESPLPLRVSIVSDRSGAVLLPRKEDLARALAVKESGSPLLPTLEEWALEGGVEEALEHPTDVVVDVTPTHLFRPDPSLRWALEALESGKDLVLASKTLPALVPSRLHDAEERTGRKVLSSATVAGGTPALELLTHAFRGDRLLHAEAVLNGSTTFLLSRFEEGDSFEEAFRAARRRGILEEDPSLDLSGRDAAAKASILHQRAYGSTLSLGDVPHEGIWGISPEECRREKSNGNAIRLVARVDPEGATVRPLILPRESPLSVGGTRNAIRFVFEGAGEIVLSGPGAGPKETSSALLSDLLSLLPHPRPRAWALAR